MAFFPIGGSFRGRDDDLFVPSERQMNEIKEQDKEIARLKEEIARLKEENKKLKPKINQRPSGTTISGRKCECVINCKNVVAVSRMCPIHGW